MYIMFIIMTYYIYYIIYVIDFSCLTFYLFRKNSVELLIDYCLKREMNRWRWLLIWVFSGISSISLISVLRWNWLYFLLMWFCVVVCLQDVLTDLSAECENLSVEGVSGTCYAHKVTKSLTSVSTLKSSKHQLWSMISLTECLCLLECLSIAGHFSSCTLHLQETRERWDSESGVQHRTCESGSAALSSSSRWISSWMKASLVLVCRSISWWSPVTVWEQERRLCWPFSCAAHIPHSSATPSLHQGAWWGKSHRNTAAHSHTASVGKVTLEM